MIAAGAITKNAAHPTSGARRSQPVRPGGLPCPVVAVVTAAVCGTTRFLRSLRAPLERRLLGAALRLQVGDQLVDVRGHGPDVAEGLQLRVALRIARLVVALRVGQQLARLD